MVILQNQNWALQITNDFEFILLNSVKTTFSRMTARVAKYRGIQYQCSGQTIIEVWILPLYGDVTE